MSKKIPDDILPVVLEKNGLEPRDMGKYFMVRCPACGKKEMFLYKDSNKMICNRQNKCGHTENLWNYLKEHNSFSDRELARSLFSETNEEYEEEDLIDAEEDLEIPEGLYFFDDGRDSIIKRRAYNYLINRGIQDATIRTLGYIFNPDSLYHQTIFIPFYERNSIVYYISRDYTGKRFRKNSDGSFEKVRYINAKGRDGSKYILNYSRIEEGGTVFIFEGPLDALSLANGIGTAITKSSISPTQASKIWERLPSQVILVPDNDEAGQNNLERNKKILSRYKPPSVNAEILYLDLPNAVKDFNELVQKTGNNKLDPNKAKEFGESFLMNFPQKTKAPI